MNEEFLIIEAKQTAGVTPGTNPKVIGLAYGGGLINLPGWRAPVVVDLAGLVIPESVPLLANHENRTAARVGQVSAKVEDNSLAIEGEITASTGTALGIVEQAKKGADWQLSIGAEVKEAELIRSGKREVNGRNIDAPFYHIKQSLLREVSVVAVGADAGTRLQVAAMFKFLGNYSFEQEEQTMPIPRTDPNDTPETKAIADAPAGTENITAKAGEDSPSVRHSEKGIQTVEAAATIPAPIKNSDTATEIDPVQAERDRVSAIAEFARGEYPEIEAQAIREGWSFERAAIAMRNKFYNQSTPPFAIHNHSAPEGADAQKVLSAALSLRAGIPGEELQTEYGAGIVDHADKRRGLALMEIMRECIRLEGGTAIGGDTQVIEAAFSTVSLPGILSNVARKRLLRAFRAQPLVAPRLCTVGDLNDFKENERFRLTDVGKLEQVAADGEIADGSVTEDKASNQIDTYGKKFVLTRKMAINDDLGAFLKLPASMGNNAARLIDQLFFARLLSNPTQGDGKKLFHIGHKNLQTGEDSALSHDALAAGTTAFLNQTDAAGNPICVEPRFLLVPTALKYDAVRLTRGAQLIVAAQSSSGTTPSLVPALNALAEENLTVIGSPYLQNPEYTGASEYAWYLFGNPAQIDTFEIGYLKGKKEPTIEKGATDFNTLGMWFRVFFDVGVREQDWRGVFKSTGE